MCLLDLDKIENTIANSLFIMETAMSLNTLINRCREELANAPSQAQHSWRLFSFGNIDLEGNPVVRYVVLRAVSPTEIVFFTDQRSDKIPAIQQNSIASLCFFSPESKIQLQVKAQLALHNQDNIAKKHWDATPWYTLQCYHMKESPGDALPAPFILDPQSLDAEEAYRYFSVISCRMLSWDMLCLHSEGNQRAFAEFDEKGQITKSGWIAP